MATGSESFRRSPSHGDAPRHDEEALARSVADAGSHAFGCLFVETWVRADDGTLRLSRPPGGRWMNPAFASSLPSEYLVRRARELDGEAEECPPGEGVAGRLADDDGPGRVRWRRVDDLRQESRDEGLEDERANRLLELGLGLVAAVPFSFVDGRGLVLFYFRPSADPARLQCPANVRFLISSADLIGAGFAIRKSRDRLAEQRRKRWRESLRKVKGAILKEGAGATRRPSSALLAKAVDPEKMRELMMQRATTEVHHGEEFFVKAMAREQSQLSARRARPRRDEEVLAQSVAEAGSNAFGCIFVEMWVLSADGTKLTRPDGGHWMNPAFASSLPTQSLVAKAWELDRVTEDCSLGAGLAGILADESGLHSGSGRVHWRQIQILLKDPFVQHGLSGGRMREMFEIGIGLVASVPFSLTNGKGLMLYFSRRTCDPKLLRAPDNVRYMISAANQVGASVSIRKSQDRLSRLRKERYRKSVRQIRKAFLNRRRNFSSMASMTLDLEVMASLQAQRAAEYMKQCEDRHGTTSQEDFVAVQMTREGFRWGARGLRRVLNSTRKWRGSKLHGPPRQSLRASLFVFVGVFLTMLAILAVEEVLREAGGGFHFEGSWYTSTLCILFALTPAPVGQPRQIVAAHLWNMLVGLACQRIPDASLGMPAIWRRSLAAAAGVSGQACLGILHPPASGLAVAFASSPAWGWSTMAPVLLVDVLVILMAVVILNLSEKQQYPLWWLGLGWPSTGGSTGRVGRMTGRAVDRARRRVRGICCGDPSLPVHETSRAANKKARQGY